MSAPLPGAVENQKPVRKFRAGFFVSSHDLSPAKKTDVRR
jgi:hypothetical protein